MNRTVDEPGQKTPVVVETDVVVVGGGPAGQAAAVAAARAGAEVTLLERYGYLGGLASGGMVLVLDDLCAEREVSVGGLALEIIDRMRRIGACVVPPMEDCFRNDTAVRDRWVRWGFDELYPRGGSRRPRRWRSKPASICAFTRGSRVRSWRATRCAGWSWRPRLAGRRSWAGW